MILRLKYISVLFFLTSFAFSLNTSYLNQQAKESISHMKDILEFPDYLDSKTLKTWLTEDAFPEGKLYIEDRLLTQKDVNNILEKLNLESIGGNTKVTFGWTLKRTYMKMYPIDEAIHKGNRRIDYNLYTLLEPFTFLAILHESSDKKWYYVHAPFMRGWVKKEDVLVSSKDELKRIGSLNFLVVLKDRLVLDQVEWGIGSQIPYLEKRENSYKVLLPSGKSLWIENKGELNEGFLSFSTERAKDLFESLLGMPYGWGGLDGNKDCSSYVRDVFLVFGLSLPRNSAQQRLVGKVVAKGFSSFEEMENLLKTLPAFKTLLFMKGHVMVYGGMQDDDIVLYHAVHSITTHNGKRLRVNKVVKNFMKKDGFTNLHEKIISVNVFD